MDTYVKLDSDTKLDIVIEQLIENNKNINCIYLMVLVILCQSIIVTTILYTIY